MKPGARDVTWLMEFCFLLFEVSLLKKGLDVMCFLRSMKNFWNSNSAGMTKKNMNLFLFCIFAVIVNQ